MLGIGLMDSLWRHRNKSEDVNITIFSKISIKFAIDLSFSVVFELINLQGPIKFFRSCRYNTGPISKTKLILNIFLKLLYLKR